MLLSMWHLPGPGTELVSPVPTSRFFTMSYQGSPKADSFQTWETISKGFLVGNLGKSLEMIKVRTAAAAAKSLQSCPTLCDPVDGRPLGSSVSGILQARIGLPFPSPMHESEKRK